MTAIRLSDEIRTAIDKASNVESDKPGRSEMLRRIARAWLTDHGFLKPPAHSDEEIVAKIEKLDAKAAALKHDGTKSPANAMKTMDRALVKGKAQGLRKRLTGNSGAK